MERIETVIVGGGQAGLATSSWLTQHGREHVVLEQAAYPASVWRDQRWDSFTLVTPNWTLRMPGAEYDGPAPDAYLPRDEVVAYFDRYVERFHLPVRCNTRVVSVEAMDGAGYRVRTEEGAVRADNVVVATGYEQSPKIPPFATGISPEVTQIHSSRYRNPAALPAGAVLVVGTAQSGCQIAEELYQSGRRVYLATGGSAGRAPRRYRGRDVFAWLYEVGFFDRTPDQFPFPKEKFAAPHVSGTKGGHTLNLHQFVRDGVTLLGHLRGVTGHTIRLAPDLHENLGRIDGFEQQGRQMIDGYIRARGLDAPPDELPQLRDGYAQPIIEALDLKAAGITSVIWATGYRYDYALVKLPVFDADGFPIQTRGITDRPGLYFVGMPWMPSLKSGILAGVGEFAEQIASRIAGTGPRRESAGGSATAAVPAAAAATT
jgi:putative flavoprotein involved in K+ transport